MDTIPESPDAPPDKELAAWVAAIGDAYRHVDQLFKGGPDDPVETARLYAAIEHARLRCKLAKDDGGQDGCGAAAPVKGEDNFSA